MSTLKKTVLICTALLFLIMSCKKEPFTQNEPEEPDLPPLTHTGANTFGCYIDGVPFVANKGESMWDIPAVSGSFNEETKRLKIQGTKNIKDEFDEKVVFAVKVMDGKKSYILDVNTDHYKGYNRVGSFDYFHDTLNKGNCTITHLDEKNNIISGKFSMDLINDKYTDKPTVKKITEGRFDFHY